MLHLWSLLPKSILSIYVRTNRTDIPHWRSQDFVLRGPENETRRGGGIPFSSRLGGLGERRKLPQRVRGGAPAENGFWCIWSLKKNESGGDKFDIVCHFYSAYLVKFTRLALLFFLIRWG